MKKVKFILAGLTIIFGININAQTVPDQNPNYKISADKYDSLSAELLQNQGETIQDTYKAYDWTEHKAEKKQARIDRRQELRLARWDGGGFYQPYYYDQMGYNYNYGYNNRSYRPNYLVNDILGTALLGAGIYSIFF